MEKDKWITEFSEKYHVPKPYIQSILYREMSFIDYSDVAADVIVNYNLTNKVVSEQLMQEEKYVEAANLPIPIGSRPDSSTGNAQIFASTAIKAISYATQNGIAHRKELEIPENIVISDTPDVYTEPETHLYIWKRLNIDEEFNIETETLNIILCAKNESKHDEFSQFTKEDITNTLARYNGELKRKNGELNEEALEYGREVYELYEIFEKYSN